jgi:hypothetical protein
MNIMDICEHIYVAVKRGNVKRKDAGTAETATVKL